MKNLICPISNDRTPEHLPRVTAFYVVVMIITYALTQWLPILFILLYDFTARASNNGHISLIQFTAKKTSQLLGFESRLVDKAPKLFAARLGTIMFLIATIFHLAGGLTPASIIVLLVGILASLEWMLNFCVGCYIYYALVYPFLAKKQH